MMKKIVYTLLIFCVSFQFTSCKSSTKKEKKKVLKKEAVKKTFSLKNAKNEIGWIAYKTTEKIHVKGSFKEVNITVNGTGNSIKEAVNNAEFSIPISSIFTSDISRDFKIRKFFFKIMNTELLSGKLILSNDTNGYAMIKMNGITQKLPFTYTISNKEFKLNGVMNLKQWKGEKAITSLNIACKDLHKGKDGISKTWDEVAIHITSAFQ